MEYKDEDFFDQEFNDIVDEDLGDDELRKKAMQVSEDEYPILKTGKILQNIIKRKFYVNLFQADPDTGTITFYVDFEGTGEELEEKLNSLKDDLITFGYEAHALSDTIIECVKVF